MIFSLNAKVERLDGTGLDERVIDICVEEIALLRIDAVRYDDWTNGEIVMRSGFRSVIMARALDWEELRKCVYMKQ